MREILFRGKGDTQYNDGDWYYGVPIQDGKDWQICTSFSKRVVLPETIGEFTGLHDKNGLKIFEFDICKYGDYIVVVDFDEQDSSFRFVVDKNVKADFDFIQEKDLEVIGNIFDNPELLKGATEQ